MYRITIKPITSKQILTFRHIEDYGVIDGYLTFVDNLTNKVCRYAVCNTEIAEEVENE